MPNIRWIEDPPLLECIKDIPDHPFNALIPTWPEATRASFARAKLLAELESEDLSIQFRELSRESWHQRSWWQFHGLDSNGREPEPVAA